MCKNLSDTGIYKKSLLNETYEGLTVSNIINNNFGELVESDLLLDNEVIFIKSRVNYVFTKVTNSPDVVGLYLDLESIPGLHNYFRNFRPEFYDKNGIKLYKLEDRSYSNFFSIRFNASHSLLDIEWTLPAFILSYKNTETPEDVLICNILSMKFTELNMRYYNMFGSVIPESFKYDFLKELYYNNEEYNKIKDKRKELI